MWILDHPKKVVVTVLVGSVILAYFCLGLKSNNAIEVWLDPNDSQLTTYRHFLETFGSEEFILVVMEKDRVINPEDLALGKRLSQQLEKIPGISKVSSVADFYQPGLVNFVTFQQLVLSEPVFWKTWVSKDGKAWALFIQLDHHHQVERAILVDQVRVVLKKIIPQGERYHMAGPPVFNVTLDSYSRRAALIFSPIIFLLVGLLLWAIYQSLSWAVLALMVAGIVILWSLAGLALFHRELNMVTSALPPLLLVISLSYTLHFLNAYQQEGSLALAISRVNKPILLSSLTTSLGFGSLIVSNINPIRDFGLAAAFGVILAYLLVRTFLPASLGLLNLTTSSENPFCRVRKSRLSIGSYVFGYWLFVIGYLFGLGMERLLQRIGDINRRKGWLVLSLGILCLIGAVAYLQQLKIEVNAINFLKSNNPMVRDYTFIEEHLMGLSPLELVVKLPQDTVMNDGALRPIRALQSFLEHQTEVVNAFSLLDWHQVEKQVVKLSLLLDPFQEMNPEELKPLKEEVSKYYDPTGIALRISCRLKTLSSSRYKELTQRIEQYTQNYLSPTIKTTLTGLVPMLITMQDTLLWSQAKSFGLAGLVNALVMLALARSLKPFILAMIPNILPIVLTFGFMGLARIPLDVATVMVASIALGMALDNTIHFIHRFREELDKGNSQVDAIYNTLHGIGRAMIFGSLVTAAGFLILCLSQFKPMIYFGLLSTITIFAALLADLFLHPVLLLLFGQGYWKRKQV